MESDMSPMSGMQQVEVGTVANRRLYTSANGAAMTYCTWLLAYRSSGPEWPIQIFPEKLEIKISKELILFLSLATNQSVYKYCAGQEDLGPKIACSSPIMPLGTTVYPFLGFQGHGPGLVLLWFPTYLFDCCFLHYFVRFFLLTTLDVDTAYGSALGLLFSLNILPWAILIISDSSYYLLADHS